MRVFPWISALMVLVVTIPGVLAGQDAPTVSREEARKAIQDGNITWGRARVAIDKDTFEKMLAPAPDFYIQLAPGKRLNRQQFLDRISTLPPGVKLTRFDASVLTVEPNGADWVALIFEKLEIERTGSDGRTEKEYVVSITRDGWRKVSNDRWQVLFSEQVSQEHWKGVPPPVANW